MLGSVQDAEDALQEALLNAWRALPRFEARSSLKSWLYRIATNACLKTIERRPRRVLPVDYGPAADPHDPLAQPLVDSIWLEPYPDRASNSRIDSRLPMPVTSSARASSWRSSLPCNTSRQAARGSDPPRRTRLLGKRGGHYARDDPGRGRHRATARAQDCRRRLPARSQQATLQALGDERLREMVDRFVDAWERADVDSVVAMLAHDATITMPPRPTWYRGQDAVASFLRAIALAADKRWRLLPVNANGQPAFGEYLWNGRTQNFVAEAVTVLTLADNLIAEITSFRGPDLFARFGLLEHLEP